MTPAAVVSVSAASVPTRSAAATEVNDPLVASASSTTGVTVSAAEALPPDW